MSRFLSDDILITIYVEVNKKTVSTIFLDWQKSVHYLFYTCFDIAVHCGAIIGQKISLWSILEYNDEI